MHLLTNAISHMCTVTRHMPTTSHCTQGCIQEFGVDIRDPRTLDAVFERYGAAIDTVWNLAAPLSVETAANPAVAEQVSVLRFVRDCIRQVAALPLAVALLVGVSVTVALVAVVAVAVAVLVTVSVAEALVVWWR